MSAHRCPPWGTETIVGDILRAARLRSRRRRHTCPLPTKGGEFGRRSRGRRIERNDENLGRKFAGVGEAGWEVIRVAGVVGREVSLVGRAAGLDGWHLLTWNDTRLKRVMIIDSREQDAL